MPKVEVEEHSRVNSAQTVNSALPSEHSLLIFKAVCIIGVITHHVANRRFDPMARDVMAVLPCRVFPWVVPGFILASGYLHALSDQRRTASGLSSVLHFVARRARRLLLPFLVLTVVYSLAVLPVKNLGLTGVSEQTTFCRTWLASLTDIWFVVTGLPRGGGIGEQLYFFPLLFLVSLICASVLYLFDAPIARARLCLVVCVGALLRIIWSVAWLDLVSTGCVFYLAGYGLYSLRRKPFTLALGLGLLLSALALRSTFHLLYWGTPMALFCMVVVCPFRFPVIEYVGTASATIFAYHVPFLLTPLLHLAAHLNAWKVQVAGAYACACGVLVALTWAHIKLKDTRFRFLLL